MKGPRIQSLRELTVMGPTFYTEEGSSLRRLNANEVLVGGYTIFNSDICTFSLPCSPLCIACLPSVSLRTLIKWIGYYTGRRKVRIPSPHRERALQGRPLLSLDAKGGRELRIMQRTNTRPSAEEIVER